MARPSSPLNLLVIFLTDDVMKHITDTNMRAADTVRLELQKERHTTLVQLKKVYMDNVRKVLHNEIIGYVLHSQTSYGLSFIFFYAENTHVPYGKGVKQIFYTQNRFYFVRMWTLRNYFFKECLWKMVTYLGCNALKGLGEGWVIKFNVILFMMFLLLSG